MKLFRSLLALGFASFLFAGFAAAGEKTDCEHCSKEHKCEKCEKGEKCAKCEEKHKEKH